MTVQDVKRSLERIHGIFEKLKDVNVGSQSSTRAAAASEGQAEIERLATETGLELFAPDTVVEQVSEFEQVAPATEPAPVPALAAPVSEPVAPAVQTAPANGEASTEPDPAH